MDVAIALVSKLASTDPVTAIVADRIGAAGVGQAMARPNLVYQVISDRPGYSNDGETGLNNATVQLSCYANDYKTAVLLATAVREALSGFTGTVAGVTFQSVLMDDGRDAPQPPVTGNAAGIAGRVLPFRIAYSK